MPRQRPYSPEAKVKAFKHKASAEINIVTTQYV